MIDAYCTAVESQSYLATYADWMALADSVQDDHLSWGRIFIDNEYSCIVTDTGEPYDETNATDEMKHANSFLGYLSFTSKLFDKVPTIKNESVSADTVSSSIEYQGGYKEVDQMFKQADLLLKTICTSNIGHNTLSLSRV